MKKKFFYIIFLLPYLGFAQIKYTYNWYFAEKQGINFSTGAPINQTPAMISGWGEGCSSISNKYTGQLLFYTDGATIYDRSHNVMLNGSGLIGDVSSTQSSVIVPMPEDSLKYYVFTTSEIGSDDGLAYSVVDMTLNSGLGGVTAQKNIVLNPNAAEKLAAVQHCNGIDYWVITTDDLNNGFYAHKITSSGISVPVITNIGSSNVYPRTSGQMKISPNGKKIGKAYYYRGAGGPLAEIYDFDNATGIVSNSIPIDFNEYNAAYGVEFSPNSQLLYFQVFNILIPHQFLFQLDLMAGGPSDIISSSMIVDSTSERLSSLQIGPDHKIYKNNLLHVDVINEPNQRGLACNYLANSFILPANYPSNGLPNFVSSFFNIPVINNSDFTFQESLCQGAQIIFEGFSTFANSWLWNFGDAQSGSSNYDTLQIPTHQFNSAGEYDIALIASDGCHEDTILKTIVINNKPIIELGENVTACYGEQVQLNAKNGGSVYKWSTGEETQMISVTNKDHYSVIVTNSKNCSDSSSVYVDFTNCRGEGLIHIPNAFSPNSDGQNDILYIYGKDIQELFFTIYDRSGLQVFESHDINKGWDGSFKGRKLNTGVFVYYFSATLIDGSRIKGKGDITLIE